MHKCLAPFFIGREEPGLDRATGPFDVVLRERLAADEPGSRNAINRIARAIRDFVASTIGGGEKPLVLCGDCLSCIGCLGGAAACGIQPHLLWFDAHGDFHTPATTQSGHLGGMPLAMITGRGDLFILHAVGLRPLTDDRVCHIGARDLDQGEREAFETSNMRRVQRITALRQEISRDVPLWVHFDTDYIDPRDAPAMRYVAPGGITADEARSDLATLADKNVVGMSISAWAPHLDPDDRTARTCWRAVSGLAESG
jgi:arginase